MIYGYVSLINKYNFLKIKRNYMNTYDSYISGKSDYCNYESIDSLINSYSRFNENIDNIEINFLKEIDFSISLIENINKIIISDDKNINKYNLIKSKIYNDFTIIFKIFIFTQYEIYYNNIFKIISNIFVDTFKYENNINYNDNFNNKYITVKNITDNIRLLKKSFKFDLVYVKDKIFTNQFNKNEFLINNTNITILNNISIKSKITLNIILT